jgi:DNA-binding NtrC family response regulator
MILNPPFWHMYCYIVTFDDGFGLPTILHGNIKRSPAPMKKRIAVLDADQKECRRLCSLLEKNQYPTIPMYSIQYMEANLKQVNCLAVFLDIDTISIDNRTVRDLTIKFPEVHFFCLSEHPFHPELKDAICYHIYACINKPVDPDELFYWLRSINENDRDSKDKSQT